MSAAAAAGYVGERAQEFHDLDLRTCICGHKSLSHASLPGAFGGGACGKCECLSLRTDADR